MLMMGRLLRTDLGRKIKT